MDDADFSRPFVERELTIYTQIAQNFAWDLRAVDKALSRAYVLWQKLSNGNFEKLESLINDIFKTLEDDLKQGILELDSRCAEARVASVSYTKIFHKTVKFTHTSTFRYIDLLLSLDTLLRSVDKLYFSNIIDASEHNNLLNNWRIKLQNSVKKIRGLAKYEKIAELVKSLKVSEALAS